MAKTRGLPILGGVAKVYCVHDREKRLICDPNEVVKLGREFGQTYDQKKHKFQLCPCCENVFVTLDDTPRLCGVCLGIPIHELEAAIAEPKGVIQ
jgi:hypothetical protein